MMEIQNKEKERFPILIENAEVLRLIDKAKAKEWYANHLMSQYYAQIKEIWNILAEIHGLDSEYHVYTLGGQEIPTLYYVKPVEKIDDDEQRGF